MPPGKRSARRCHVIGYRAHLLGTPLDLFGYAAERRPERQMIRAFEEDMEHVLSALSQETLADLCELARLPSTINGFGHVKQANAGRT